MAVALLAAGCGEGRADGRALRVSGSTTVNPVVAVAAERLGERGLRVVVDTEGGSSGGIAALAEGRADVAMSSRPLTEHDRAKYPQADFRALAIGADAVALAVSRDVWEGGVHALDREQARALYEERVTRWSELGGPDERVVFLAKEPGRGTWEVFADWLYPRGDVPLVAHLEVGSNEEARTKAASTPGAITQLSVAWTDGATLFPLALRGAGGESVAPSGEAIADGSYPLSRPLLVITRGEPSPPARALFDYLLGTDGQRLVEEAGYLPLAALAALAGGAGGAGSAGDRLAAPIPAALPAQAEGPTAMSLRQRAGAGEGAG